MSNEKESKINKKNNIKRNEKNKIVRWDQIIIIIGVVIAIIIALDGLINNRIEDKGKELENFINKELNLKTKDFFEVIYLLEYAKNDNKQAYLKLKEKIDPKNKDFIEDENLRNLIIYILNLIENNILSIFEESNINLRFQYVKTSSGVVDLQNCDDKIFIDLVLNKIKDENISNEERKFFVSYLLAKYPENISFKRMFLTKCSEVLSKSDSIKTCVSLNYILKQITEISKNLFDFETWEEICKNEQKNITK